MMNENERLNSPKNRWTRWYMWLAYGGILVVIAVGVVIVAMAPAPGNNGKTAVSHQKLTTLTPDEVAALIRQHASINSPAEVNDLQSIANQDGITLDESIMRFAWRDDFSKMVTAIEKENPDSVVDVAMTQRVIGLDQVFRFHLRQRPKCHRQIPVRKPSRLRSAYKPVKDPGFTKREVGGSGNRSAFRGDGRGRCTGQRDLLRQRRH